MNKENKKYYCKKHGNIEHPDCKECIKNLKKLYKDIDASLFGDIK